MRSITTWYIAQDENVLKGITKTGMRRLRLTGCPKNQKKNLRKRKTSFAGIFFPIKNYGNCGKQVEFTVIESLHVLGHNTPQVIV